MTRNALLAGLGVLALGLTSGAAIAQGAGHGRMDFDTLDADGNGQITLEEMEGQREQHFAKIDTNGDGKLDKAEMVADAQARVEANVARMMKRFDKDGDGLLAEDELPGPKGKRAAKMFERVDRDNSGGISKEEFAAARERMKKRAGKPDDAPKN